MTLQVVWLKRDLRLADHWPLWQACQAGPTVALYVIEPSYWQQPDTSVRQWQFVAESLRDVQQQLADAGIPLWVMEGEVVPILAALWQRSDGAFALHSHEEYGTPFTYARDRAVAAWCREHGVEWQQTAPFGVRRPGANRDTWADHWHQFMSGDVAPLPIQPSAVPLAAPDWPDLTGDRGSSSLPCPGRQQGGSVAGQRVLDSFLRYRCGHYRGGISAPQTAQSAGSRLSPYLAWGCLSLRQVVQTTWAQQPSASAPLSDGLAAFESRLWWHCHFIQKLEDDAQIAERSVHPLLRELRDDPGNPAWLSAWQEGRTGWPMVDACMAYLAHHGWINFRMRAMLMSIASYPLWLHWHQPALHLARLFVDYEPGIHFPQVQMQAGVTGINVPRMYNPTLQAQKLDPKGTFIRRWVPALAKVPAPWVHQPWRMNVGLQQQYAVRIGHDYPAPLVDFGQAIRGARAKLKAARQQAGFRSESQRVHVVHGSRKDNGRGGRSRVLRQPKNEHQLDLF